MSLYEQSGLTTDDLARRLNLHVDDDATGMQIALEAACSDIEPHVQFYEDEIPQGLKMAILDVAATRYDRTNLSVVEAVGALRSDYTNEYNEMFNRIASYRKWPGL